MARGIGNRQKKVVSAKKAWIKFPLTPRERDGVRGQKKPRQKSKSRSPAAPSP